MSQSLCFLALGLPAETTVPAAPGPCLIQPAYSMAATEFDLKIELHRRKKMVEKIEDESQIRGASASEVVRAWCGGSHQAHTSFQALQDRGRGVAESARLAWPTE